MIQIDPAVYIWFACLLIVLPLNWVFSALFAAVFHEACHMVILLLLRGKIKRIHISLTGCQIESTDLGGWQAMCSILAGPAGSMLLMFLSQTAPKVAVCGLFHGLYNLLPIFPLDGGRIMQQLLFRFQPQRAQKIQRWVDWIVCLTVLIVSVSFSVVLHLGVFPVILVLLWILRFSIRKIPCKPSQIKVQ